MISDPFQNNTADASGTSTEQVLVGDAAIRIGGPHRVGTRLPSQITNARRNMFESFRDHLRELKKSGQKACYEDDNILKPNIAAMMDDAARFKKRSFVLLVDVYHEVIMEIAGESELENMYIELFEDMLTNKHDWDLFYSTENSLHVWAERSTAILLNLANNYRLKKKFDKCRQVMAQYKFVIDQYNAMIKIRNEAGISDNDELVCVRTLTFRYHRCAYRLAYETGRFEGIAKSLRFLLQYEIDTKVRNGGEFLWMLVIQNKGEPYTSATLQKISNDDLQRLAAMVHGMGLSLGPKDMEVTVVTTPDIRSMPPPLNQTGVFVCAGCKRFENKPGDFQQCARCKHAKYCGRACQKLHYPEHKTFCKIAASANSYKGK